MEHIAAIMVLVGCMQTTEACREVPAPTVAFETVEECRELLAPAIEATAETFKRAYGACAEVDPALFVEDATIEWQVTPRGQLRVDVRVDDGSYAVAARHDRAKARN
ncbi:MULTISPECIES: hypothetical protein [unclassified Ensifer]|uniref:hypothetical protein n=1 Tax=unclassified Ensifer TaxID=2633371 RepID=UPI0008139CBD|nr:MULTISPECIES: hypothetical protein [unclassified Ensifer]OCP04863.1 hypothetical protein BC362_13910 [Ensifer sp. LC14]OCP08718.1 hypothetical protein BBX50_19490 [Ensifer sp. LC11]OCP09980.1 hypothetical protein BC374_19285 [Ensifer sp. LC13]OCP33058.1 hypothetical protein BC364_18240 [Ensifer sp. LC499]